MLRLTEGQAVNKRLTGKESNGQQPDDHEQKNSDGRRVKRHEQKKKWPTGETTVNIKRKSTEYGV